MRGVEDAEPPTSWRTAFSLLVPLGVKGLVEGAAELLAVAQHLDGMGATKGAAITVTRKADSGDNAPAGQDVDGAPGLSVSVGQVVVTAGSGVGTSEAAGPHAQYQLALQTGAHNYANTYAEQAARAWLQQQQSIKQQQQQQYGDEPYMVAEPITEVR